MQKQICTHVYVTGKRTMYVLTMIRIINRNKNIRRLLQSNVDYTLLLAVTHEKFRYRTWINIQHNKK